jgi:type IV pilus assembly protein PilZ
MQDVLMGRRELLRVDAQVEVQFKSFEQFYKEYTSNISRGGIFIQTGDPLPKQSVLEVRLILPHEPEPVMVVGEVVHVIDKRIARQHGWNEGMGVQFVDYEETAKQAIDSYVKRKFEKDPSSKTPDRRRHLRVPMRLRVKFPDMHTFLDNYASDISQGGIFIESGSPKQVGEILMVILVHPDTDEELELEGEVVRVSRHDPKTPKSVSGMAIKFINMTSEKRRAIDDFLAVEYPISEQHYDNH